MFKNVSYISLDVFRLCNKFLRPQECILHLIEIKKLYISDPTIRKTEMNLTLKY